jgi:hypothetical protein
LLAYLPACGRSLVRVAGGFTGTKRPSLGGGDARKMASKRNRKISDSIVMLPGVDTGSPGIKPENCGYTLNGVEKKLRPEVGGGSP